MKLLIDPGHGGHDSGAVSHDGKTREKDIVLAIGLRIKELIYAYGEVEISRADDSFVTLSGRARKANQFGADLLSIHCNAGGGKGFEVFTSPGETPSDAWATAIIEELEADFPERPIRKDLRDGDPDKEERFTVLTKSRNAAVLVELGFIDTEEGRAFLFDPDNQEKLAQAIAKATLRHNGLRPMLSAKPPSVGLTIEERLARLEALHPEIK